MENSQIKVEKYCAACGNGLIATAAICPKCGSPTGSRKISSSGSTGRNKTTAVLLAVFLGFWTYLYTFSEDSKKFWISLSVVVGPGFLGFVMYFVAEATWDTGLANFSFLLVAIAYLASLVTWLVALITTVKRGNDFFENY